MRLGALGLLLLLVGAVRGLGSGGRRSERLVFLEERGEAPAASEGVASELAAFAVEL